MNNDAYPLGTDNENAPWNEPDIKFCSVCKGTGKIKNKEFCNLEIHCSLENICSLCQKMCENCIGTGDELEED